MDIRYVWYGGESGYAGQHCKITAEICVQEGKIQQKIGMIYP